MDVSDRKTARSRDNIGTGDRQITSKVFTDLDNFREFFRFRGHEMIQLNSGSLEGGFFLIKFSDLYFAYHWSNQGIHFFGDANSKNRKIFNIVCFENGGECFSFRHPIEPQRTLFGFNSMGADFVANRGGVMMQIGISLKIFHTYAEQLQRYDLDDCFWRNNNVNLLPTEMAEIKNYLQQIFRLAVYKPTWLHQPHIEQLVTDDFIPLFMSQIPIKRNSKSFFKPFRQSPLIVRAEQKMLNYLDKPLTLKQLAEDLESSSSALSRGFRNLFGISPMRYLKVRRLHAVRQHLKASEPEDCTIAILANQFGFYNPSHFTKDYKIMFGELPSETLRNKASVNLNIDIDDIEIRGRKSLLDRYML